MFNCKTLRSLWAIGVSCKCIWIIPLAISPIISRISISSKPSRLYLVRDSIKSKSVPPIFIISYVYRISEIGILVLRDMKLTYQGITQGLEVPLNHFW